VLIDPEYKPQKISFDLKDVSIREAIDMLALQSRTFWRPLSSNTIYGCGRQRIQAKELNKM